MHMLLEVLTCVCGHSLFYMHVKKTTDVHVHVYNMYIQCHVHMYM